METATKIIGREIKIQEMVLWLLVFVAGILLIVGIIKSFFM